MPWNTLVPQTTLPDPSYRTNIHQQKTSTMTFCSVRKKNSSKIHDKTMSHLCWKSRCAFRMWKAAGRPRSSQLYDERRKCKCDVQRYLNRQPANQERRRIQKRDDMFSQNYPQRFRSGVKNHTCEKLIVNNSLVTNTEELLATWVNHFETRIGHNSH